MFAKYGKEKGRRVSRAGGGRRSEWIRFDGVAGARMTPAAAAEWGVVMRGVMSDGCG